jgi:hypothetical protein
MTQQCHETVFKDFLNNVQQSVEDLLDLDLRHKVEEGCNLATSQAEKTATKWGLPVSELKHISSVVIL